MPIGIIRRLFKGERVTDKTDWYTMQDAALQLLPLQEDMPFVVASQISPSGMTLAGKYGIGIISLGSMSSEGLMALPTQWGFAEDAAKKNGHTVDRKNWRVLLNWHVRGDAREGARAGAAWAVALAQRIHRRHAATAGRHALLLAGRCAWTRRRFVEGSAATIGTPDDLVKMIKDVYAKSGGFGTVMGFVHDWANPRTPRRSWDMVARYVIPEINGYVAKLRESQKFLIENRAVFERAQQAIMAKIMQTDAAAEALKHTKSPRFAAASARSSRL